MGHYDKSWDKLTKEEKLERIKKNRFPCFLQPDRPEECNICGERACQIVTGFADYDTLFPDLEELRKELEAENR